MSRCRERDVKYYAADVNFKPESSTSLFFFSCSVVNEISYCALLAIRCARLNLLPVYGGAETFGQQTERQSSTLWTLCGSGLDCVCRRYAQDIQTPCAIAFQ